jgi:hypothetical protein
MCKCVRGANVQSNDIDIYFQSKEDAIAFAKLNFPNLQTGSDKVGLRVYTDSGGSFNLIHGIAYRKPEELITRFDFRAISIALDPTSNTVYAVRGALFDVSRKRLVYNPLPNSATIARLVKYVNKGFSIDPYQRLFLAELLRSDTYNADLELRTGYRADTK